MSSWFVSGTDLDTPVTALVNWWESLINGATLKADRTTFVSNSYPNEILDSIYEETVWPNSERHESWTERGGQIYCRDHRDH